MTEACLNQSLDALLARSMLMREDYELVVNQPTRTAKVRQLLDNCHKHNEDFCRIVVRKLHDNKQMGLQPYPAEISSPTTALITSPSSLSTSYNIPRNMQQQLQPSNRNNPDYRLCQLDTTVDSRWFHCHQDGCHISCRSFPQKKTEEQLVEENKSQYKA